MSCWPRWAGWARSTSTSPTERAVLDRRAAGLGARQQLDTEWPLVVAKLAEHRRAGDPVESAEVRATARRLFELVELFTGEDPAILGPMLRFLREPAGGDELLAYLDRAQMALRAE